MRIAITGGTGFVGRHLARRLAADGVDVVIVSRGVDARDTVIRQAPRITFVAAGVDDADALSSAFAGCGAVAHCAGINREIGRQTYARVHIGGTRAVVEAARRAGVKKIALLSFLRARPDCGSAYHESKFAAEEIVRESGLDFTILKSGMIYGRGDHMLDHLSRSLMTLPLFLKVGMREQPIRPVAIDDLVDVLRASLVDGRLTRSTVAVTGAEQLLLSDAVKRVARVMERRVWILPAPIWLHDAFARVFERMMTVPLVAVAQARILAEGVVVAAPPADTLPGDLQPGRPFTDAQIRSGLPDPERFSLRDLRCCHRAATP
jgi:nucleoside-diphosphate-sugar epimerase